MEMIVNRYPSKDETTIGQLLIDSLFTCYTLEDKVRENFVQAEGQWKIFGKTAIPAGRYKVTMEDSGRFGPKTLTVNNVPGYTSVRMHPGNTNADTEGCILLGMSKDEDDIYDSRIAVDKVKSIVGPVLDEGSEVWITIITSQANA
jgi:hypothetical protein